MNIHLDEYVYKNNGKNLVAYYGDDTEVLIPRGVTWIDKGAFSSNLNLTGVDITDTVEIIDDYAFV